MYVKCMGRNSDGIGFQLNYDLYQAIVMVSFPKWIETHKVGHVPLTMKFLAMVRLLCLKGP